MAQMDPALRQEIERAPDQPHNLIVRVEGDLVARQKALEASGFKVKRSLRLINALACSAKGANVRQLASQPWVISIEQDQQVHTT